MDVTSRYFGSGIRVTSPGSMIDVRNLFPIYWKLPSLRDLTLKPNFNAKSSSRRTRQAARLTLNLWTRLGNGSMRSRRRRRRGRSKWSKWKRRKIMLLQFLKDFLFPNWPFPHAPHVGRAALFPAMKI